MNAFVEAARKYIGQPYRHLGRGPVFYDCAGLPIAAARDCGRELIDLPHYGPEPFRDGLRRQVELNFGPPVERAAQPGDLVLLSFKRHPHHLGIVGDYLFGGLSLIHAYADVDVNRVVEHRLDSVWASRIVGVYEVGL